MPGLFILFWAVALLLLGLGWAVSCGMAVIAWRRKWRVMKWVFAVIFAVFTLVSGSVLAVWGYGAYRSSSAPLVFEDTFRMKPPPGTAVLHGKSGGFADSAGVDLSFRTDRVTFDRLRPGKLERTSLQTYNSYSSNFTRPWWRAPTAATEIWMLDSSPFSFKEKPAGQSFYSEVTFMTWDSDGLVQYMWSGID